MTSGDTEHEQELTDFGRYFHAICKLLGTNEYRVATEAGIPQPTLRTWTKDGKRPSDGSLEKLFRSCREKYPGWRIEPWERGLTNLANHVTQEQKNEALDDLVILESEVQNR